MINVTKTFLPPLQDYIKYLEKIWDTGSVTNHGPLVQELENKLKKFLGVKHLFFVSNGTVALQIAIKALELKGEIITTPFSYVATVSSIFWENCTPVLVDIDPDSLCINYQRIEDAITSDTEAILAVHVYGNPCMFEEIEKIAKKHNLKLIYDAAHAFGVKHNNVSVLNHGDISTLSFHATKVFHTVEGGAVVTNDDNVAEKIYYMRMFGHAGDTYKYFGINAKNSELHAAMGLCNLPYFRTHLMDRKKTAELYDALLLTDRELTKPHFRLDVEHNYSYYPLIFNSEKELLNAMSRLQQNKIFPRRYFYPSLSRLNYVKKYKTPISDDISRRVLCLPLYAGLSQDSVKEIAELVLSSITVLKV